MRIIVKHGDILAEQVDVLICPANPQLNMSGGINGEILRRGGSAVQAELHGRLAAADKKWAEPGTVVTTLPGPLPAKHLIHAVAIDAFYHSDAELVRKTVVAALEEAARLGAATVALPALATGYGRLPIVDFAAGVKSAIGRDYPPLTEIRVVLRRADDARLVRSVVHPEDD